MKDTLLTIGLASAFGLLVTIHVAACFGLRRTRHRAGALAALFLPPLAPYWTFIDGMRVRSVAWIASASLYAVAIVLARR